jgi:hypothetical protein
MNFTSLTKKYVLIATSLAVIGLIFATFPMKALSISAPTPETPTPSCDSNEIAYLSLDGTSGSYGFFSCFVKPLSYQLKIVKASLVKADGSGLVDIYTPQSPVYQDLVSGEVNLLDGLDLTTGQYAGVYSGLVIIFDNDIRIKARAKYSGSDLSNWAGWGSGVEKIAYCHTLERSPTTVPDHLNSFAGSANGNPAHYGDHPTFEDVQGTSYSNPGLSTFRYLGSPMTGSGIIGRAKVANGVYQTSVTFDTKGATSSVDFDVLDSGFQVTNQPEVYNQNTNRSDRNARYARYEFKFKSNFSIASTTKQLIDIKFDLDRAIGFAWSFSSNGSSGSAVSGDYGSYFYDGNNGSANYGSWNGTNYYNGYPDCLRMFIGKIDLSVTSTIITPSSVNISSPSDS